MNPEVKALWLPALRSGEYTQERGALRQQYESAPPRHCCLGVLSELAAIAGHADASRDAFGMGGGLLPASVREWAGLTYEQCRTLVRANDADGRTFAEIADYIEREL